MRMSLWRWLVLWSSWLLLVSNASGADKGMDVQERTALSACLAGDYVKGIAILSDLYATTRDPAFIYNQGRCFEQNHRYSDAISRFQEFQRVARRASKAEKAEAQKHIAECKALLAQEGSPASTTDSTRDSKEAKEKAAKKACLTGDSVAGVAILTDLFIETNDPTYLFNQGRCFEQNRRYDDAIGRFREYLVKAKNLRPEDKEDTKKHISDCESYVRQSTREPGASEVGRPKQGAFEGVAKKPSEEVRGSDHAEVAASTETRPGRGLRVGAVVAASLGVAGLATGLVLNLKANQLSRDVEADWDPDMESSRKSYQSAGWIAYGVGAACLAGGALLYYLGTRAGMRGNSVALVPTAGGDAAGAVLMGAF